MLKIQNVLLDKENGVIKWSTNGKDIVLHEIGVDSALADKSREIVIILTGRDNFPDELKIYSATGENISNLKSPDKFDFYYLSNHPTLGVSVICVTDAPVDNWRDWHFGYDIEEKKLFRHCPAY